MANFERDDSPPAIDQSHQLPRTNLNQRKNRVNQKFALKKDFYNKN